MKCKPSGDLAKAGICVTARPSLHSLVAWMGPESQWRGSLLPPLLAVAASSSLLDLLVPSHCSTLTATPGQSHARPGTDQDQPQ